MPLLCVRIAVLALLSLLSIACARPLPPDANVSLAVGPRQDLRTQLLTLTDLDLGDISPVEDGFFELDSDDGSGNDNGSSSVSNANGYLGSIGSGQAAAEQGQGVEGSSAACSLTSCVTSASAANDGSTSTSSTGSSLLGSPLISGTAVENNAPLLQLFRDPEPGDDSS